MTAERVRLVVAASAFAAATSMLAVAQGPADLLAAARQALGGDAALTAVTSFTITGSMMHEMEGHRTDMQVEINCVLPDKFVETERQDIALGPVRTLRQ